MRLMFMACLGGVLFTASGLGQTEPTVTFGTTVVDNAGLRGTIYYLKKGTAILPDTLQRLKPKGTIYTRSLNVTPRNFREGFPGVTKRFEWFALDYQGRFWIERGGMYRFALTSDDGSLLFIDDHLLIDNDRVHPAQTKEGSVDLARGVHTIQVTYFQGPADMVALMLKAAGPGEPLRVFSMDEFRPPSQ